MIQAAACFEAPYRCGVRCFFLAPLALGPRAFISTRAALFGRTAPVDRASSNGRQEIRRAIKLMPDDGRQESRTTDSTAQSELALALQLIAGICTSLRLLFRSCPPCTFRSACSSSAPPSRSSPSWARCGPFARRAASNHARGIRGGRDGSHREHGGHGESGRAAPWHPCPRRAGR